MDVEFASRFTLLPRGWMDIDLGPIFREALRDITLFSAEAGGLRLRKYQVQVAQAIVDSVMNQRGLSFVVIFPRQSGKNELQAQIEAYLLITFSVRSVEMIKVSPTWKPQSLNAMRRLERALKNNLTGRMLWSKHSGYIYQFGQASMHFLSGSPASSIVGATASLLLECDEAQDVSIEKWDKEIAPMAASTNATRVFWGTAWTSKTLLAREMRAAKQAELTDGVRRTWWLTADEVGAEVLAYRTFVQEQVRRLGRNNPLVRTQYFSEEIDADGGMFSLERRALMLGSHARQDQPQAGQLYAFTVDVAGQDEAAIEGLGSLENPGRDSTVLTIFEVDIASVLDPLIARPTYRVVNRIAWQGVKHSSLYTTLLSLVETWAPLRVTIDATGVGAGLAGFLHDRLGSRLVAFEFTQSSKSQLGWDFITVIETGRYKEYCVAGTGIDEEMMRQLEACQYSILDGPRRMMRWGVPDGKRDPLSGEWLHDDYILSAALISLLDHESWGTGKSQVVKQKDILDELAF